MTGYGIIIALLFVTVILLIRAEFADKRKQIYLFKPISTTLLIMVAVLSFVIPSVYNEKYTLAILIALLLSFGGDIALMFKSRGAFMAGLALFLLAHIAYAIIFTVYNGLWAGDLISGLIILVISGAVFAFLYSGLDSMKVPVLLYIIIIGFMLNRAFSTLFGDFFTRTQAVLITLGAGLFYISDIILAVNRFKKPFKYNRISLAFYYSGQLCIALSTGLFARLSC